MLQGAGSNVGKSVLVAGLCRHFANSGLKVLPFKPQNMSNNAAVTVDGGEIGRAQALQARACRAASTVDMNPVLLKPESETGSQIIVQGQRFGSMKAREYGSHKATLLPRVLESFERLRAEADLVIVEGAGSPAEVNLRAGDIANMGFAVAADVPVVMIGDIDRGGVIASLVGTQAVLDDQDRDLIKGFLINKFRGDTTLFADGMTIIEDATGWQGLGILPWFGDARYLPAEDILDISGKTGDARDDAPLHIAVPKLRRIANFDDLDPLAGEDDVQLTLVEAGDVMPADADLILLPDRNPRFPTWLSCVIRVGISTLLRTFAEAGGSWACAEVTRCLARLLMIRMVLRGLLAVSMDWGTWMLRPSLLVIRP